MKNVLLSVLAAVAATFRARLALQVEILALRHQLAAFKAGGRRPKLRPPDRRLWAWLSRVWPGWRDLLVFVQPATVVAWQRNRFRRHWAGLSAKRGPGRPKVAKETRDLIYRMSVANPTWGSPRIRGELRKLGIKVAKSTVEAYMEKRRKPSSPTWRTFLESHVEDLVSIDFFTVPTVRFTVLFVFLVLSHHRRRVVHFGITTNPTAAWTAQQVVEAFPWDEAPRFLLRDRDSVYGSWFRQRVKNMGIEEVVTSVRSPWQSPYVERLIGSIRRECLNHVIVFSEGHLRRFIVRYFDYYHRSRTRMSLGMDCPEPRPEQSVEDGRVVETPQVFGLHHRYERRAA